MNKPKYKLNHMTYFLIMPLICWIQIHSRVKLQRVTETHDFFANTEDAFQGHTSWFDSLFPEVEI